jgi:hypothetical protein
MSRDEHLSLLSEGGQAGVIEVAGSGFHSCSRPIDYRERITTEPDGLGGKR